MGMDGVLTLRGGLATEADSCRRGLITHSLAGLAIMRPSNLSLLGVREAGRNTPLES